MDDRTLAHVFWSRVEASGDAPAHRFKHEGQWRTLTWRQVGDLVREVALGLLVLGRQKGDAVALLSSSRAEWVQADFAILSAGCVTIPVYPSYTAEQLAYIVNDSGARTLIVEDPLQLAKAIERRAKMENLAQIVVIYGFTGQEPSVHTWEELRRLGREHAQPLQRVRADRLTAISPEDVATIVYTSGTTGPPKGVVQTHANHLATLRAAGQVAGIGPGDIHLLFLPLAHSFARMEAFLGPYVGLTTAFAESLERVPENLREIGPHFICSVPRVFEKVHAKILASVDAGSPLKKKIFHWAATVGRQVSQLRQARRLIPVGLRLKHRLAHWLVFAKLHHALGGRLRFANSGGAPLAREIAEFFHAAGILVLEGYGLTETCPALTFNRADRFKFGSVGQPLPGVELRIASDGEILARGPNVATQGYFKKPEATVEAFEPDGWFHTGDIGRIDAEGFLFITDRKKDLIVTAGGMNIAPQNVENLLKGDPFISHVLVYGDRRPYPVALITVSPEELVKFAREQDIPAAEAAALAQHAKVIERVGRIVTEKNSQLQSYARIKRFAVLAADFTQEGGELTPTLKIRRKVVVEKYHEVITSLYA